MKRISCVLLACAVAMGLSGTSAAAAESFDTEVVFGAVSEAEEGAVAVGLLLSDKKRCLADRLVAVTVPGGTKKVYDTDTSSKNGAWGFYIRAFGPPPDGTVPVVSAKKKVLKDGTVCKGAQELFGPPPRA